MDAQFFLSLSGKVAHRTGSVCGAGVGVRAASATALHAGESAATGLALALSARMRPHRPPLLTPERGTRFWIAAFREDDAEQALTGGYLQFGRGGFRREVQELHTGDRLVMLVWRRSAPQRDCFFATGEVTDGDAYVAAEQGRERWRRDVAWSLGQPVALSVIAHELQVVQAHPHRRLALPRNRCAVPEADYKRLETALAGHWVPSPGGDEPRMTAPRVVPAWRH